MAESLRSEPAFEHNGRHVARTAFYAIACDPRRSVAVEACAGAGKTWMLVSRILRALLVTGEEACAAHEILAITFTKKAAGEMRQRLDDWLADFSGKPPEDLVRPLIDRGMDEAQARAAAPRLATLQRTLLESGRAVQFRTFHAWFAGLLRHAPLALLRELGLPANYSLLEDDAQARARCWRPFFEALLLDHEAQADYQALVDTHGRFQTTRALDEALARRVEFALADAWDAVEPFGQRFPGLAHHAEPLLALVGEPCRQRWLERARALGRESGKTAPATAQAVVDVFGTGPVEAQGVHAAWATLRAAFFVKTEDRLNNNLRKFEAAQEAEAELAELAGAQNQHAAWLYQRRMTRLARVLVQVYAEVKRQHGWVDMNDVEQAAQRMLADSTLSGWVQERLDARTAHLLIDEFQDTNPLQWQALYGWLSGYAGAGARAPRVFIVGDPKQSIYRFRRAEPQVFIAAKAFVREALGGDELNCDHTHRNARAVIALVNSAMGQAQADGQFQGFRAHTTQSDMPGVVHKLPQVERATAPALAARAEGVWRDSLTEPRMLREDKLLQRECAQAANFIAQAIASGTQPSDIMVLARRRDRLAALQDALRERRIPTQQPENNALADAPEVQDLLALVDALVSPTHDLSLARALKSPLFGLSDDDLVDIALRRQASPGTPWLALLAAPGGPPALQGLSPRLARWQAWLAALPPHDALNAIYHDGDVLARFAAAAPPALCAAVLANLRALLAAALAVDGGRFTTPYGFVRALRADGAGVRAASVTADGAVQLLTVHGAKGLEGRIVLLLDCDAAPPRAQTMGVLVDWPGTLPRPRRFVFLASEKSPPVCAADLLAREHAERSREELNGLYVATTRARERLVLSSAQPHVAHAGSWWQRLQAHGEEVRVEPIVAAVDAVAPPIALQVVRPLPATVRSPLPTDAGTAATAATLDARAAAFGQAMHRLLEWQSPDPALVRAAAREFGLPPAQAEAAAGLAKRIRAGAGAWAWDAEHIDWQGNEVPLVHAGEHLRIDRLVRHRASGVWWVLDYKTAARPERDDALLAQLRRYRAAVRAIHGGAPVRAAFLTGQGELVELQDA